MVSEIPRVSVFGYFPYTNKDNFINYINSKLNKELVEESIIDTQVYNNKDNSSE